MQRIIQITLGGRVIPIEEQAYDALRDYISSLERQFAGESGKDEIIHDIENRIAELFAIKLEHGDSVIVVSDVQKVMETLGHANEINEEEEMNNSSKRTHTHYQHKFNDQFDPKIRRLYRNPNDKLIGGVCSGVANYFDIDPVLVRLVFAILFLTAGIGVIAYILAWIIIPAAKTPQQMYYMTGVPPMDFDTFKRNVADELQDLKKKGEEMSQELKEFFKKKK